jgi:hypothetical protein
MGYGKEALVWLDEDAHGDAPGSDAHEFLLCRELARAGAHKDERRMGLPGRMDTAVAGHPRKEHRWGTSVGARCSARCSLMA